MIEDSLYKLYAHVGSPYSMKIRAILRYRRIPHIVYGRVSQWRRALREVRVPVMPVLEYPDGSFHNDSTPLLYDLESRHTERSIIPVLESDAFLAYLIEDLADEWVTKAMYAYRWSHPEHTDLAARLIAYDQRFGGGLASIEMTGGEFEVRQVSRNALVGCTEANGPMIDFIAAHVLDILESHVVEEPFLFGTRPSLADFGLFGQISQFVLDLAAIEPCRKRAPYTMRWIHHLHDLSGHEGNWRTEDQERSSTIHRFLDWAGEAYFPFLLANLEALQSGRDELRIRAHGLDYVQPPFKYQVKCLMNLRKAHAGLSAEARTELDPILEGHGCLDALVGA